MELLRTVPQTPMVAIASHRNAVSTARPVQCHRQRVHDRLRCSVPVGDPRGTWASALPVAVAGLTYPLVPKPHGVGCGEGGRGNVVAPKGLGRLRDLEISGGIIIVIFVGGSYSFRLYLVKAVPSLVAEQMPRPVFTVRLCLRVAHLLRGEIAVPSVDQRYSLNHASSSSSSLPGFVHGHELLLGVVPV